MLAFTFLVFPLALFAQTTMLSDADLLSERYNLEIAREAPPSNEPRTDACLDTSIWFTVDLNHLKGSKENPVFNQLSNDFFMRALTDIGVEAIYLENLKERSSFAIDPKFGDYENLVRAAKRRNLTLIGNTLSSSTGWGPDFEMALQNVGEYPSLFHLIEIDCNDWSSLPKVGPAQIAVNIPWLTLQELQKKGYVPERSDPYMKESDWNATMKIRCLDGKVRRWIYLKEGKDDPVLSWLSPSFGAGRIAAGGSLDAVYRLNQNILTIDSALPLFAKETLSLWIRKLSAFSVEKMSGGVRDLFNIKGDLAFDILTRPALLHALVAEDAEALRLIYRIFLEEGVEIKQLVHSLQPFDQFACTWSEFLVHPRKKYKYWQEQLTADILRKRLMREDLYRLGMGDQDHLIPSTWADYCAKALGIKEAMKKVDEVKNAHLLLALTYAMQPGAFSFSASDLLGALPESATALDLTGKNPETLYPSLPVQMKSSISFASKLKSILEIRKKWSIAKGEIVEIPNVQNQSCLILVQKLYSSNMTLVLAVNFGRGEIKENIDLGSIRRSNAIELLSGLTQEKVFESPHFSFALSPLSGKVFLFQQKYYD